MAKKKQEPQKAHEPHPITKALDELRSRSEEQNKEKTYEDFLKYANTYNDLDKLKENIPSFPRNVKMSAYDTAAPYYGSEAETQLKAASEYANQLSQSEKPLVKIDPAYYEELKRQVPLTTADTIPHYNKTRDFLSFPNPITYASYMLDLGAESLSDNNYTHKGIKDDLRASMSNFYRDTAEHEAGHIADKHVTFEAKPQRVWGKETMTLPATGYMGQEDHLVTGLSKIQREQYAMTGERFSPQGFKSFILDLAKKEDPETEIQAFSEEARRALRAQLINAKAINRDQDELKKWESKKGWFKGDAPMMFGDMDFLEKSAQLIPALVKINTRNNDGQPT
jgi:hypothetical protein